MLIKTSPLHTGSIVCPRCGLFVVLEEDKRGRMRCRWCYKKVASEDGSVEESHG